MHQRCQGSLHSQQICLTQGWARLQARERSLALARGARDAILQRLRAAGGGNQMQAKPVPTPLLNALRTV